MVVCRALVSQLAEETDSKPVQCEFESHRGHRIALGGIRCASIRRDGDNLFKSYRRRPTRVANRCGSRRPRNERDRRQLHQSHDHHGPQGTGYNTNANTHAHGRTIATAQPICSGQGGNRRNQPSAQIHGHHWDCSFVRARPSECPKPLSADIHPSDQRRQSPGNPAATRVAIRCTHLMNFGPTVLVSSVKPVFGTLNHRGTRWKSQHSFANGPVDRAADHFHGPVTGTPGRCLQYTDQLRLVVESLPSRSLRAQRALDQSSVQCRNLHAVRLGCSDEVERLKRRLVGLLVGVIQRQWWPKRDGFLTRPLPRHGLSLRELQHAEPRSG